MITPVGNRKTQVNQGLSKNETILGDDMFKKVAWTPNLPMPPAQDPQATPDADPRMQEAVSGQLGERNEEAGRMGQTPEGQPQPQGSQWGGVPEETEAPQAQEEVVQNIIQILQERQLLPKHYVHEIKTFNAPGTTFQLHITQKQEEAGGPAIQHP